MLLDEFGFFVITFNRFALFIALLSGGVIHGTVQAQEPPATTGLRINGFGTLGLTSAWTDFGGSFRRDISQPHDQEGLRGNLDSRVGVQVNYAVNERLELVGQTVFRQRPSPSQPKDSVEWAFAAYKLTPQTVVRVGRTGLDLFLQSDYRNVGFAYVAARPNVDFYSMLPLNGSDGVDISHRWNSEDVEWRLKGAIGKSSYSIATSSLGNQKGDLSSSFGVSLSRESDGLLVRATAAQSKLNFKSIDASQIQQGLTTIASVPVPSVVAQAQSFNDQIRFIDITVNYGTVGVLYDRNNWLFTSELMRTRSNASIGSIRAGYAMVGRRFGNLTLHGTISGVRSDVKPVTDPQWGQALAPLAPVIGANAVAQAQVLGSTAASLINSGRVDQRTVSLGLRWDFDPRIALKLQWDRVHVERNGGTIWTGSSNGGKAQMGTVMLDFLF